MTSALLPPFTPPPRKKSCLPRRLSDCTNLPIILIIHPLARSVLLASLKNNSSSSSLRNILKSAPLPTSTRTLTRAATTAALWLSTLASYLSWPRPEAIRAMETCSRHKVLRTPIDLDLASCTDVSLYACRCCSVLLLNPALLLIHTWLPLHRFQECPLFLTLKTRTQSLSNIALSSFTLSTFHLVCQSRAQTTFQSNHNTFLSFCKGLCWPLRPLLLLVDRVSERQKRQGRTPFSVT